MTRKEAGRLGGLETFRRYGREHMRTIGKKGYEAFRRKYSVKPVLQSKWAIVDEDGKIVSIW